MRILPDYRCIYIHIPKTAGNSITEALDSLPQSSVYELPPDLFRFKHIMARDLKIIVDDDVWSNAFKFAFVRNPWDQMVSSYNWWTQKIPVTHMPELSAKIAEMGFDGFMASPYGQNQINEFEGNSYDWISDESGDIILDHIGRFETLQESWVTICDHLGVDPIPLPHLNQTEREHYREYYTDRTREQVAQRFRLTIETFGYKF